MTKVNRQRVVAAALDLLDEVGLDGMSTRQLAQRLGVEQPSLYWHFKRKSDLLAAMTEEVMATQRSADLPVRGDDWQRWFIENHRRFRRALLLHRDGARLHAGTFPGGEDLHRVLRKVAFLTEAGFAAEDARMAMLAASRFTLGSALEEQADAAADPPTSPGGIDHAQAFDAGLRLLVDGLASRRTPTATAADASGSS